VIAKVCGLLTAEDVDRVLAAGADLVGFLHHPPSPRHCPDLGLARLAGDRAVLVTVAADAAELLERVQASGVRWVQPYLPVARRAEAMARLREAGCRVLLPWPDEPGQERLAADLYLWETSARDTGLPGGSGQGHPAAFPPPGPFLLAGGLTGAVLAERFNALPATARSLCRGFDAASRLDRPAPARGKEPMLVEAFLAAAHALAPVLRSEP
jgi:phosphoribosylanthranilate isomerase